MTSDPVHYAPLDCIVEQPPLVLAVCGKWCDALHGSISKSVVTCDQCLAHVALWARLADDAVATPGAVLIDRMGYC